MYFHVSIFNFCFSHSSGLSQYCPLDNLMFVLCFLFVWKRKGLFLFAYCSLFSMMSEWNESCTESISYIQVNSSIIKDQIGVLSVLVSQPALEGHLVADHGKAWPCSDAFSGCYCHQNGG